jgi:hypothetical protein
MLRQADGSEIVKVIMMARLKVVTELLEEGLGVLSVAACYELNE